MINKWKLHFRKSDKNGHIGENSFAKQSLKLELHNQQINTENRRGVKMPYFYGNFPCMQNNTNALHFGAEF